MEILVTGGGGFLGQAIVQQLLARGDRVRILNRSHYPELDAQGVQSNVGDIADIDAVMAAADGVDAIIHVAAKAGSGLYTPDYYQANVVGTENVLSACHAHGIQYLVYTSSPSVVHAGGDIEGGDESLPYATHFDAPYPETKAQAEALVLKANSARLKTVALRPHLIWGPGDNQLLPRLIEKNNGRGIRLPAPHKKIDTVYVDNAAEAHLLALDALIKDDLASGRAFFISNGEPMAISQIMTGLIESAGYQPNIRSIPAWLAMALASVVEGVWRVLRRRTEPPLSRFVVEHLATAHWYDLSQAREVLGYIPRISIDQGLSRLRERQELNARSSHERFK